jgi:protein dithiol oxidoreductase (disulfide-forming)
MNRHPLAWALGILACCLALGSAAAFTHAQEARQARLNVEYRSIGPLRVETGDRIEVIDFFWYGCPHCYNLQPALEDWIRSRPPDVAVRRIPVILRDSWAPHARIYYTLEALGEIERLHQQVYHGYHVQELHMGKPDVMAEWAVRHGIDRQKWLDAYNSKEVAQKVQRAKDLTRAYDVQGTPSLAVDGRYLTSASMVGGQRNIVPALDDLVRIARAQRLKK